MRVLLIDIETTPHELLGWDLWNQNFGLNQIVKPTEVMCFAAKWLGEKKVYFASTHHDGKDGMLELAHRLLDEADVVMHWNGKKFDIPHLKRELLEAGFLPPAPFAQLDLLLVVRKEFKFASNKLQHVSKALGLAGKVQKGVDMDLWVACMAGDEAAWRLMKRYNIQDTRLLEGVYERIQGWIPSHPNRRLYDGHGVCPKCGAPAEQIQRRGYAYTAVSKFRRHQCQACGGWFRSTHREDGVELTNVAA